MYTEYVFFYVRRPLVITGTGPVSRHEWKCFVLEGAGQVCCVNVLRHCSTGDL